MAITDANRALHSNAERWKVHYPPETHGLAPLPERFDIARPGVPGIHYVPEEEQLGTDTD